MNLSDMSFYSKVHLSVAQHLTHRMSCVPILTPRADHGFTSTTNSGCKMQTGS